MLDCGERDTAVLEEDEEDEEEAEEEKEEAADA